MDFVEVVSSNIQGIAYEEGDLYVRFTNGSIYRYFDVPIAVYEELLNAESKGRYFIREVKHFFRAQREA